MIRGAFIRILDEAVVGRRKQYLGLPLITSQKTSPVNSFR